MARFSDQKKFDFLPRNIAAWLGQRCTTISTLFLIFGVYYR